MIQSNPPFPVILQRRTVTFVWVMYTPPWMSKESITWPLLLVEITPLCGVRLVPTGTPVFEASGNVDGIVPTRMLIVRATDQPPSGAHLLAAMDIRHRAACDSM